MGIIQWGCEPRNYYRESNHSGWVEDEANVFEDDLCSSPNSYGQIRPRENSIISISQDSSSDSQVSHVDSLPMY